jgi:hypothetical protein
VTPGLGPGPARRRAGSDRRARPGVGQAPTEGPWPGPGPGPSQAITRLGRPGPWRTGSGTGRPPARPAPAAARPGGGHRPVPEPPAAQRAAETVRCSILDPIIFGRHTIEPNDGSTVNKGRPVHDRPAGGLGGLPADLVPADLCKQSRRDDDIRFVISKIKLKKTKRNLSRARFCHLSCRQMFPKAKQRFLID